MSEKRPEFMIPTELMETVYDRALMKFDELDSKYRFLIRIGMDDIEFSIDAKTHTPDTITNEAEKNLYLCFLYSYERAVNTYAKSLTEEIFGKSNL